MVFGEGASAACQCRDPAGEQRGFRGRAGCGWFPCSIFLLPSLRGDALSTLCGWEGRGVVL